MTYFSVQLVLLLLYENICYNFISKSQVIVFVTIVIGLPLHQCSI